MPDGLAEQVHAPELPDGAESRDVHISSEGAHRILDYLHDHHYAGRDHVVFLILWKTAMRRSALRSLDVDDLRPDDNALVLEHRIDEGTRLKNGEGGERWVYLGPSTSRSSTTISTTRTGTIGRTTTAGSRSSRRCTAGLREIRSTSG